MSHEIASSDVRPHHVTGRPTGKKVKNMHYDLIYACEGSCTGDSYHLLVKVHKVQIRMKTGSYMVQCFWLWQDRC